MQTQSGRMAAIEARDAKDQVLALIADPFRGQMANQSLFASLGISLGFSIIIAVLFSIVRPHNSTIYQPKLKHALGKPAPPPLGKSVWAWIPASVFTSEAMMIERVGIDAALFIRHAVMWRNVFLIFTLLGCLILIPVSVVGGRKVYSTWDVSSFLKMTPQFVYGRMFWAYIVVAYVFNVVLCTFLFFNYRAVVRMRRQYYDSEEYQKSLYSRTLMVTNIPPKDRSDASLYNLVDKNRVVEDVPRAVISRNVKGLPDLIESHEGAVRKLEAYLAKYLRNPDQLPAHRPVYKPTRKERPLYGSEPIDAISHFTGKIQSLEREIMQVRASINSRDVMSYGFISYPTIQAAHYTAFAQRKKHPDGTTIRLAPRPSDLIWRNLGLKPRQRRWQKFMNNVWVVLLTLVWTVPNGLIAIFLTNLSNLASVWPAFNTEMQRHPKTWAVVQGVLSPALTSLFYFFLPTIFRRLSIRAGDVSKVSRERHVTHKLYAFFVFNNLIIFSLFSTVWKWVSDLIMAQKSNNRDLVNALKTSELKSRILVGLCNMSPFWIFWLLQRNLGAAIDLSQVANLAWVSLVRRFTNPTPRDLIELTAPPVFDYASYYNYFLFYATVAICFAPLQPLVLPVAAFYFGVDCYLKRYLLLYVFITKSESGGQFWRILFNRSIFAAFMGNVVVAVIVAANGYDNLMLYALIPLPIGLIWFKWYCHRKFDNLTHYFTTAPSGSIKMAEVGLPHRIDTKTASKVVSKFGHPALYKKLFTPMVHANARAAFSRVYSGRTSRDVSNDLFAVDYSDQYSVSKHSTGFSPTSGGRMGTTDFRFVSEADIDDHDRFASDPDFRQNFFGDADSVASGSQPPSPTRVGRSEAGSVRSATGHRHNLSLTARPAPPGLVGLDGADTLTPQPYPRSRLGMSSRPEASESRQNLLADVDGPGRSSEDAN